MMARSTYDPIPAVTHRARTPSSVVRLLRTWIPRARHQLLQILGVGIFTSVAWIPSTPAAEKITVFVPPLREVSLSVDDLEIFAKEGRITDRFAVYARYATPEQLAQLRDVLNRNFALSPVAIKQFTYSPLGETLLRRITFLLNPRFPGLEEKNVQALRGALILAADEPEGLTTINILRQFPWDEIRLDVGESLRAVNEASTLLKQKDEWVALIKSEAQQEEPETVPPQLDITQQGPLTWEKQVIRYNNPERERSVQADVYLPQGVTEPVPVVIISHGIASNRDSMAYLAEHLASYGYGVGVPEHPDTSSERFRSILEGYGLSITPQESAVARPWDVSTLLDAMEERAQQDPAWQVLDTQRVGLVGQSLGGYTVLSAAGAPLNFDQLRAQCEESPDEGRSLNLSKTLQCGAVGVNPEEYRPVQDDRIQAVVAVNPVSSILLGPEGLAQIEIPTMKITGSDDYIAPSSLEQIRPFTWLTTEQRYLVLLEQGTHFSFLQGDSEEGVFPVPRALIGPDPELAHPYLQTLTHAFFQVHLQNQPDFAGFLSETYLNQISTEDLPIYVLRSLTEEQLEASLQ